MDSENPFNDRFPKSQYVLVLEFSQLQRPYKNGFYKRKSFISANLHTSLPVRPVSAVSYTDVSY